jgi:hypothetical protein
VGVEAQNADPSSLGAAMGDDFGMTPVQSVEGSDREGDGAVGVRKIV